MHNDMLFCNQSLDRSPVSRNILCLRGQEYNIKVVFDILFTLSIVQNKNNGYVRDYVGTSLKTCKNSPNIYFLSCVCHHFLRNV